MVRIFVQCLCLAAFLAPAACRDGGDPVVDELMSSPAPAATSPAGLARVSDPRQVCMVTDQVMTVPLIPVEVGGHTYYGCCPNCKARLASDPAVRVARDPVTGEEVDKSEALIARLPGGRAVYFASEESFLAYDPALRLR
jgi:YHS domain-containing protein